MDDMVPGLLKSMSDDFQSQYDSNEKIQSLNEKLNNGTATYKEANEYASEVGSITESTYETYLTSENLPDGKCYYNIAERVTSTTLHNQYELVADYTEEVQTTLNQKAGIGLKAQRADEDTESYKSLANYMSAADYYDDVALSTAQSAARMAMSTVDNSVKKNTEFQGKSGLSPKIIRNGGSGCCEWCSGLSGTYDYPKVPSDVYARHNNCTCTVEYDPGSGKRQDVWTKEWTSEEEAAEKEELKSLGLNENGSKKISYKQKSSDSNSMNYRKELDEKETYTYTDKKNHEINAKKLIGSPNNIYISDNLSVKPKKVQQIENVITECKSLLDTKSVNYPKIVLINDSELGNSGGRYDAESNTIFYKIYYDNATQKHSVLHELYHWEDAENYKSLGNDITSNINLIEYECAKAKSKLDNIGISADNVANISDYAKVMYEKGRFDEVYTEYRTVNKLR